MLRFARDLIADLLAPPRCIGCRRPTRTPTLCPDCVANLPQANPNVCPLCHRRSQRFRVCPSCAETSPLRGIVQARGPDGQLRHAVHALKYRSTRELRESLGSLLAGAMDELPPWDGETILVPVPVSWWRRLSRGFNQAEELARVVGTPTPLLRRRHRGSQASRTREERLRNLSGAFRIDADEVQKLRPGRTRIILVDDILTTGATLAECGRVLAASGFTEIWGLVLSRGTK